MLLSLSLLACDDAPDPDHARRRHDDHDPAVVGPCEVPGNVCTWLGVPDMPGFTADGLRRTNPPALGQETTLAYLPLDVTFGPDGTGYFVDYNNHRLRAVDLDGIVTTVSGPGFLGDGPEVGGGMPTDCWTGCDGLESRWRHPGDVQVDPWDTRRLVVAAWGNGRINVVDTHAGTMTWLAGAGARDYAAGDEDLDGDFLDDCEFDLPSSVAFASDGAIYVSDQANHLVRRIDPDAGTIADIAGEPRRAGMDGDGGPAGLAHLHASLDLASVPASKLAIDTNDLLYAADTGNGVIRTIDLHTGVIDTFAGRHVSLGIGEMIDAATGERYEGDLGSVPGYAGDGGPAIDALMNEPADLAVGIDGEVYIADTGNHCVRVVRDGIIERFAGRCGEPDGFDGDGGPALDATFGPVHGVAVDPDGNVYVADTLHHVIRRVRR